MAEHRDSCPLRNTREARAYLIALGLMLSAQLWLSASAHAESRLNEFLRKIPASELFPSANKFGPAEGLPPAVPAYRDGRIVGYVFLNSDFADATGYSGKPIHILLGLDTRGVITGARLAEHHEPIVLIGIPETRVIEFISRYVGTNPLRPGAVAIDHSSNVAVISGATVTVMIISDSIGRAAHALAVSRGMIMPEAPASAVTASPAIDMDLNDIESWAALLGDGSVRRLHLSAGEIDDAFARAGAAPARAEPGGSDANDIDLHVAPVSVPAIGLSLLGPELYGQLASSLAPGQQAVLIAGGGGYSFKGSGYVRGGIFDRIRIVQGDRTIRFRDRDHRRIGEIAAAGAPHFPEIGAFVVPVETPLDPTRPWRLQLLVQRQTGALDKVFLNFDLGYTLPTRYIKPAPTQAAAQNSPTALEAAPNEVPLWRQVWDRQIVDIGILLAALGALTFVFFFQDRIVRHARLTRALRIGFLVFAVVWIGGYAHAQLSVVNVVTFTHALLGGLHWEVFLLAPIIFILWFSVAASLLFWGRGAYCGWLCPFGALQELLSEAAKLLRIPQIAVPWGLNQRLWPIKYIAFLIIFGASLGDMALAERLAELEPFKTVVILLFDRAWPYVLYGTALLAAGLFVERFFCRYLCPLGAALAIPGRMRMFDWLLRHRDCGAPCQRCAGECIVQAIHPDGRINPHECHYCLYCQVLYYDDRQCPPMIQRRLKKERWLALSSKSMLPEARRGRVAGPAPALVDADD